jgi:hypothetical protein
VALQLGQVWDVPRWSTLPTNTSRFLATYSNVGCLEKLGSRLSKSIRCRHVGQQADIDKPRQLVITIEEAHRFLDSSVVHQTIFGTIAREMRKYFVTLLVVDQRPSGIDNEVMSQIGTRVTCLLNDEKDIEAIFTGVSGGANLKSVLTGFQTAGFNSGLCGADACGGKNSPLRRSILSRYWLHQLGRNAQRGSICSSRNCQSRFRILA